ncbi:hypothetical protein F5B19DRAFT_475881 [Rostrohypoxylon terebratum]|nr:hypothetical protein F5B19DRAFT_475881 [Rostrohypoxylon terebratum]
MALYGVPFAVKDNVDVETFPTIAACPAFSSRPVAEDALVVNSRCYINRKNRLRSVRNWLGRNSFSVWCST